MRCIYYDTETTGVRVDKDAIVEIAAFDPDGNREFVSFVQPGMPIPEEASAIHGITEEMVKDAPPFADVAKEFITFCGEDAVLLAHNNDRFDKLVLHHEGIKHEVIWPANWMHLDTLTWARRYRPDLPKHSLQFLREIYNLPANTAHRALDDVIMLHQVFSRMTDDLPLKTIIELLKEERAITHMPFGKHRGKPIEEVPSDYVQWLKKSGAFEKRENESLQLAFQAKGVL